MMKVLMLLLNKTNFLVILVIVIGTVLRILYLTRHDFWYDEAFTYHIARLPILDLFKAVLSDNNPPLYYLIIHFLLKLSSNEIILRIPSVIANITSIVLLYTLLNKFINRNVGLIASALFSLSPLAIYIGTEARLHSLAMLLSIGLVFSFSLLIKKPDFKAILTFFFVATLALYTQYYLILLFIPFTIFVITKKQPLTIKKWIIIAVVSLATLAPWITLSLGIHNNCSCPNALLSLPAALISPVIGGVGEVTLRTFTALPYPVIFLFAITVVFILFFFIRGLLYNPLLTFVYMIPLALLSVLGLIMPVFSPRAFAIFSPFYFGIVAYGITTFKQKRSLTVLVCILLGTISLIQTFNSFFAGEKLKSVYTIIKQDDISPIVHTSLVTYYSINYYSQGKQRNILLTNNPLSRLTVNYIGGGKQHIDNNMVTFWFVDTKKWVDKNEGMQTLEKIFKKFRTEKEYTIGIITVRYMKLK